MSDKACYVNLGLEPFLAILLRRRYMDRIRMVASLQTQQYGHAVGFLVMGALGGAMSWALQPWPAGTRGVPLSVG